MTRDVLTFAAQKVSEGKKLALVTVTETSGSSPATPTVQPREPLAAAKRNTALSERPWKQCGKETAYSHFRLTTAKTA